MKNITLIILVLSYKMCFGQDTLFFDAKWNSTTKANAEFFRIDKKVDNKWTRTDYYKTNQIQMKGTYSSLTPETEDGYFEWYHANGKLKHKGSYKNGKHIGEHLWYGENGNIEAKENYKDGKLNGAYEEYYSNGKLRDKSSFLDGIQDGWTVYYRDV